MLACPGPITSGIVVAAVSSSTSLGPSPARSAALRTAPAAIAAFEMHGLLVLVDRVVARLDSAVRENQVLQIGGRASRLSDVVLDFVVGNRVAGQKNAGGRDVCTHADVAPMIELSTRLRGPSGHFGYLQDDEILEVGECAHSRDSLVVERNAVLVLDDVRDGENSERIES